jgi:hypothetical protein
MWVIRGKGERRGVVVGKAVKKRWVIRGGGGVLGVLLG